MLGAMFFICIFAFAAITVLLSLYYKFVSRGIYGRMDAIIKYVASERKPPDYWVKRAGRLNLVLESGAGGGAKRRALEKYLRYIEADANNLMMMAERAGSFPEEGARADAIAALNGVRDEAVGGYKALLDNYALP
jgi:hypothetical protein